MQGVDGSVLSPSPHVESTSNSPATDQGVRHRWRGIRDIQSVLSEGAEVGGVPGRWMPGKGEQPRENQRTLHVSSL